MKKLMIALAAMGMAVMANAAAVEWSVYNYDDVTGPVDGMFTGTMYINCAEAGIVNQAISIVAGQFDTTFDSDCEWDTNYSDTFILTGTTTVGEDTWTYTATTSDAIVDYSGNGTAGFDAGTWVKQAGPTPPGPVVTPEPTSGLLLLLGVAGLALRRRRA